MEAIKQIQVVKEKYGNSELFDYSLTDDENKMKLYMIIIYICII
jgi:hypothetical protein